MPLPIALQMYTVRDIMNEGVDAGFARVAEIGFEHVELAGLYDLPAAEIKALLDKHGLTALGSHTMFANEPDSLGPAVEDAKVIGQTLIAQPFWPQDRRSVAGYEDVVAAAYMASQAHPGLTFAYHNHDFEFEPVEDGRTGFEVLFEATTLASQLDVAWVCVGGQDPLAWIDKLKGRVPALHMKDAKFSNGQRQLCEAGTGEVPLEAIAKAAPDAGVKYLVVEQDNAWIDDDPIKSAQISLDYLKSINP
ncbi:MAG: sugar phosphate isomerase/epimerase [Planctomycetota bacterium]